MKFRNFKLWTRKFSGFMRRHVYSIAIVFCVVLGIAMVVTTVVVSNSEKTNNVFQESQVVIPDDSTQKPVQTPENEPSKPVTGGEVETETTIPVVSEKVIVFEKPLKSYTMGMGYAVDSLLYSNTLNQWQTHSGVDFIAKENDEVYCVYDGVVEKIENDVLEGYCITIKHSDMLKTIYKSLTSNIEVEEGDSVKAGDVIGYVGLSSIVEQKEGAHLHFEVLENNEPVDPMKYLATETK